MQSNPLATQAPRKEKQEQMSTWEDNCAYLGTSLAFWNARALDFTNKSYINLYFRSRAKLIQLNERDHLCLNTNKKKASKYI